ncbi:alpha/beta hydrolase family protein [Aspergillus puulaauensis]|uniref:Alpha/beta-hydrolase n=1 Tax=Aspergillus puulaauensis TaxID=1220207 RepID=A0A7R7XKS7_9EURO|nr:uncharacterized protein APUU_31314S [Aspergillus puulaauensis]BCS23089.1 hypothetical protein APUU_31314S [Aspergillus puulaauensis]
MKGFNRFLGALGGLAIPASASQFPTQNTHTSLGNVSLPVPSLVTFGTGVVGGLFHPIANGDPAKAKIGVLVMHAEQDYTTFYPCTELPVRGYTTLCLNNAQSKTGEMSDLDFETMMSNVGTGVDYLRSNPDIEQVIVWGHSGGGAMMAAYQDVAENGASACNGTEKIYPCSSAMDGLPPADGVLLIDANYGLSTMTLLSINPAITNESTGADSDINPALNIYSKANGWTENGANYTSSFMKQFWTGVAARWNRIQTHAIQRNTLITAGKGDYTDDEGLVIPDANYIGFNNKAITQDTHLLSHTVHKWPLLHKNGRNTTQVVPSVRVASAGIPSAVDSFYTGALKTTITRFLSTFAIRIDASTFGVTADNITGVDWSSSQTAPIASVQGITKPLLAMGNTGHYEYLNAEKIYLAAKSSDKSIGFVEGAQHTIETCTECERVPGEFGDTVKTAFDFMDLWLGEEGRFIGV